MFVLIGFFLGLLIGAQFGPLAAMLLAFTFAGIGAGMQ
ncbi:hypothetical protein M199_gp001 [Halogranum tailed virus 1]|uniref:Uncharacterized protein n=1 Tax=Halogranum tailed virus 1 TaxID=1273749 RepID=R4TGG4_9CAUD|nr:hypothetical protein M199_gp001 [Halogranum tailed virus 1]AGM11331.1 hypothetical protein HGTV1_1 [Halogranum tailed virus 1]